MQEMSNQPRYDPLEANAAYIEKLCRATPLRAQLPAVNCSSMRPSLRARRTANWSWSCPRPYLPTRSMHDCLRGQGALHGFLLALPWAGRRGHRRRPGICGHSSAWWFKRGFPAPPTYHQDRLRKRRIGHFFDVITNGTGRMPPHGYLIPPEDRWAIAAYVRALQLSQFAQRGMLTENDLQQLVTQSSQAN